MAIPRVFVSSTCYDLRYVRENLVFFIGNMGFEPVLSEEGTVFYDPTKHVQDACLAEVANCQMFVLIIGGRLGSKYKDKTESIVNYEYREAANKKIPVFAMVEQQVHAEYRVYQMNKENKNLDASKIAYPGIDSTKIFEFMEEVQGKAINNALVPFSDYSELESYLSQQWAGMMFSFLTQKSESERVASMLDTLSAISNRVEFLSKQILSSVGQDTEKLNAELYEITVKSTLYKCVFPDSNVQVTPESIIKEKDFRQWLLKNFDATQDEGIIRFFIGPNLRILGEGIPQICEDLYRQLQEKFDKALAKAGTNRNEFLEKLEQRRFASKK